MATGVGKKVDYLSVVKDEEIDREADCPNSSTQKQTGRVIGYAVPPEGSTRSKSHTQESINNLSNPTLNGENGAAQQGPFGPVQYIQAPIYPQMQPVQTIYVDRPVYIDRAQPQQNLLSVQQPNPATSKVETIDSRAVTRLLIGAIFLLLVVAGGLAVHKLNLLGPASSPAIEDQESATIDFEAYWHSKQPSLMRLVVDYALAENPSALAQSEIIRAAQDKSVVDRVRSGLLRLAFDPHWEAELTGEDRLIALGLSLSEIAPEYISTLPPLSNAHPGVVLAVASEVPFGPEIELLKGVPIKIMHNLPGEMGRIFAGLEALGITTVGDKSALALCHILTGKSSPQIISAYFSERPNEKLQLILPLVANAEGDPMVQTILAYLTSLDGDLGDSVRWFSLDDTASWKSAKLVSKFKIALGQLPSDLSPEQYADLLRFPVIKLRERAVEQLNTVTNKGLLSSYMFLAGPGNTLTRRQTIFLSSVLSLAKGETGDSFLSKFFEMEPDPAAVVKLLLIRTEPDSIDSFSFEAARYLINKSDYDISVEQLEKLTTHPEPLARALAYSRADISNPRHVKILRRMVEIEPKETLRNKLREKLMLSVFGTAGIVTN